MSDQKLYQLSDIASIGAGTLVYLASDDGASDGKASFTQLRATLAGVLSGTFAASSPALDIYTTISPSANVQAILGAANYAAIKTLLTLTIGTDVQAYDAELAAIAGLTSAADRLPYFTGSGTASLATFTAAGRALVDDADAAAQRTTLGLGSLATASTVNGGNWSGTDLAVVDGGTGASTASGARTNLGVGTAGTLASDTDGTLAANSDSNVPTQKAVKTYVTASVAAGVADGDKGDIVVSSSGTVYTIDTNVVTDAKFRQSAGLSIVGRSANSTGNTADITAASDGQVMRRSGTAIGFGAVDLANANAITGTLPVANHGFDKARAYLNSAANSPNNTWGKCVLDTVDYDTNSIWDSTNKRFIPKKAGYYLVNGRGRTSTSGGATCAVGKNGSQTIGLGMDSTSTATAAGGSCLIFCNGSTDYLELFMFTSGIRAYTTGSFDTYLDVVGPF